jgi:peptide/nickel transport system permease protein
VIDVRERRTLTALVAEPGAARSASTHLADAWSRWRVNRIGLGAMVYLGLASLIALAAPLLSMYVTHQDPTTTDLAQTFVGPTPEHWLGTDQLGRDTLTRLIFGARISLGVGFLTTAVQLTFGGAVGLLAGYYGGWLDELLMRLVDIVLAFPAIFLFLSMALVFRPDAVELSLIIASVGWGLVARLVRGEVLSFKNREFVLASRCVGAGDPRIMLRHLLPNVAPVVIVAASLSVGQIILVEAGLDFLGLGVPPTTPSWGNMLTSAQTLLYQSALLVLLPGIAIASTVLAATLLGNTVRDVLDPRLRNA